MKIFLVESRPNPPERIFCSLMSAFDYISRKECPMVYIIEEWEVGSGGGEKLKQFNIDDRDGIVKLKLIDTRFLSKEEVEDYE